uniref:Phospholipid/glycerol acyltransferase domain-containing protein n=1 Tax=Esox lucius TaxID=8010 RepID=A0A3P8Z8H7_ESOLU
MKLSNNQHLSENGDGSDLNPPLRNPFVHELRFTPLEKIRIGVMTVTVFPVRLLFAAFLMLLAWPFAFAATLGRSELAVEEQTWWRRLCDTALRVIMRAMWFCGGFHWVTVKGRPAPPSQAPILTLAPHSSYFDAIPITMTMASIVMKTESKNIPLWGTLIKFIRPVFVSRSDQDSRRKTVEEIKRRAHGVGEWPQIMIFPEGTCTNRSCLITFKPGAFIPAVPVQPVVLRYPNKMVKARLFLLTLALSLSLFTYLPLYTPSEEEKNNPALFANNVRSIMAKALELPVTDLSFDDCQLSLATGPLRVPSNSSLLQFNRLARRLGLRTSTTDAMLQLAANRARKLWGDRLGLEDFAQYLDLPVTDMLTELHGLFNRHGDGLIDVREYVIALSVVCRPSKAMDTLRLAFGMYGAEEDGAIMEKELASILRMALGVPEVDVTELFTAIDTHNTGKITYGKGCHPDFSHEYLLPSRATPSIPHTAALVNGFSGDSRDTEDQTCSLPGQKRKED